MTLATHTTYQIKKRLLIVTQKMSKNDPVLGFFHRWVTEFSLHFESIVVVCLEKGEYDVPKNVRVISLGKELNERSGSRISLRLTYAFRFLKIVLSERHLYNSVFVHMNQEYILLAGILWKLLGKKVTLWRNHHSGNAFTNLAALFCKHVFCTSQYSYTAKYKQTMIMPVGIDTELFKKEASVVNVPHSVLFLARIAPVKKPDLLLRALGILMRKGEVFTATIVGDPLPKDEKYFESLKTLVEKEGVRDRVTFCAGISNDQTVRMYNTHELFVNLSSSGMYDKTIFESMACESLVLASNKNLKGLIDDQYIFAEDDANELAQKISHLLALSDAEKQKQGKKLREVVIAKHSLQLLAKKLTIALS